MERLTEKGVAYITSGANIIEIPDIVEGHKYTGQAIIKLGQYEDIEEELGVDLITFFKAMEKDIWIKWNNKIMFVRYDDKYPVFCEGILFCTVRNVCDQDHVNYCLPLNDYGNTWALTREELL